jgi:carbon-monoxide dehydrogenase medium subunit
MKPAPFDYVAPTTIDEACRVLAEAGGGATLLAGGQTLMPLLNLRMSQPFILVDLNRIEALKGITRAEGGTRIGPMTRQCDALTDETLAEHLPVYVEALSHVGHHQTRNRGTVGGSIALGEPAAEQPASAVALGATIELTSTRGKRRVPADEFYLGPYMTVIEPDELVTAIDFPDWPKGHVRLFREVAQRPGDFALVGQTLSELDAAAIADLAVADTAPFTDHHASAEYRRTVGKRIFARTLREALDLKVAA